MITSFRPAWAVEKDRVCTCARTCMRQHTHAKAQLHRLKRCLTLRVSRAEPACWEAEEGHTQEELLLQASVRTRTRSVCTNGLTCHSFSY